VTPGVLVASNTDDQIAAEDDSDGTSTSTTTTPAKPAVQVDEQLTKALDILKAKTA
jgi:carboxyl-terminal processing protease